MKSRHPLVVRARTLRKNMTPSERRLWEELKGRRLEGRKFRRQSILAPYIVDFYCHPERLVVEIDGEYHDQARSHDAARDLLLRERYEVRVLRFKSRQVFEDLPEILAEISEAFGRG